MHAATEGYGGVKCVVVGGGAKLENSGNEFAGLVHGEGDLMLMVNENSSGTLFRTSSEVLSRIHLRINSEIFKQVPTEIPPDYL